MIRGLIFFTCLLFFSDANVQKIKFTEQDRLQIIDDVFGETGGKMEGRSGQSRLSRFKTLLEMTIKKMLNNQGWVQARFLAKAISVDVDLENLDSSFIKVRGPVTACHRSPICLDLACGRCFDPLTSMHADCGQHSYFKCESLLPVECLPWTCAASDNKKDEKEKPLLRNFLPRASTCDDSGSLNLVSNQDDVTLIGLGLTLNALTSCSEQQVCFDEACLLCYDPLEQQHAPCPPALTVHPCSSLPIPCRPFFCWPRENTTGQNTTVLLRDFPISDGAC